ncbi:MAG: RNA pyrophosphohydrolase [Phreatobacter sp.]|uniref:RNA pyrophosphohydrolase n=1 Tax=Phreatobacter sp. TaxID=1966341 RepID=UPI0040372D87
MTTKHEPHDAYRPNVGVALFNGQGRVLIARRIGDDGPEVVAPGYEWQMPQGGIDPGESPEEAARRELFEETGVVSATLLARLEREVHYDWPPYDGPPHRLAHWRGQRQVWFAFCFNGPESEIDLAPPGGAAAAEFDTWRWERLSALPSLVVPYKRAVYEAVASGFAPFGDPSVRSDERSLPGSSRS